MVRQILPGLMFWMCCAVQAQLHHGSQASMEEHMREVNMQWAMQGHAPPQAAEITWFDSESQRIAHHLFMVRQTLSARTPEGLSADQQRRRSELLERLDLYAGRGLFPRNHILPFRNPIFIDPYGTACAVGHLMIQSGYGELAARISSEMNTAYLLDMQWPEIGAWAVEHGFAPEELAWIQPAYPPTLPWGPVGGGTNGPVQALVTLQSGELLVAGSFTDAGGTTVTNVAVWDGAGYSALSGGVSGEVSCAIEHDGDIYLGGSGFGGNSDLAHWNGSTWTLHTIMEGKWPQINVLHAHDGDLYAGGSIMGFAGEDHVVRRINSDHTYHQMGSPLNGRVLALASHAGVLVAGGEFTGLLNQTDPLVAHIALLEGEEWSQLADGLDAPVRALLSQGGELFAGGDLFIGEQPAFGLARITGMGGEWQQPLQSVYFSPDIAGSHISALVKNDEDLYFSGRFFLGTLFTFGRNLGHLDLSNSIVEPMILVQDDARALALWQNRLVLAGEFDEPFSHITALDITTAVQHREMVELNISPNPAVNEVMVRSQQGNLPATVEVLDATGRVVSVPVARQAEMVRIHVQGLAPGQYMVRSAVDGRIETGRFVKE